MTARAVIKDAARLLPAPFAAWFAGKGWTPRPHQVELLAKARAGRSTLLIAPTGAGKTLAGFLPSLVSLYERPPTNAVAGRGIHTLYISPLKALAVDIARNLEAPVAEIGLKITMETRTGDTSIAKRQRQKLKPPDILLTTPEQAALLLSAPDADRFFGDLDTVILDELHALVTSKRGDLLALGLARLRKLAPNLKTIGLSATVADPDALRGWLVAQEEGEAHLAELITVKGGAKPDITILDTEERLPWSGHSSVYAVSDMYEQVKRHKMTLLFVNVRSQAELIFQELWRINKEGLPIALHHGSLDATQRRKVEAAMVAGKLRAVVCTSTLDLGIDWGDVDLVVNVGAPKGASRLAQRIGRANHRLDEPSKAILVPANRFEVLECRVALEANYLGAQDTPKMQPGALDVLAQHILGMACSMPFASDDLYREVASAYPYRNLPRETFDQAVEFVATGGYALKTYERFAKIRKGIDNRWRVTHPRIAQQYRLNVGTIIEAPLLNVRVARNRGAGFAGRAGRAVGKVEEGFIEALAQGDTFLFAGLILRFEGIHENEVIATRTADDTPKIPIYAGGKFPITSFLADGVRTMLADDKRWSKLPEQVADWLRIQKERSVLPKRNQLLVETFPRGARFYMVCYPFEGRLAHQTLGMLLTRRLERAKLRPVAFVATDYALAIWGLGDLAHAFKDGRPSLADLFDEDMLGDDLEDWMADSYLLKRMFRNTALISGLIEKRHPGKEKTGRQVTISTDLIYDVLRRHEPDHILMRATWADAATGLLEIARVGEMLARIKGHIVHKPLDRISPLALPAMLQIGRESVASIDTDEHVLREAAEDLIEEAMGDGKRGPVERVSEAPLNPSTGALVGVLGVVLEAFPEGALWWADTRMLVVADLHLEKGSSFARRGQLIPPYDTFETLSALARLIARLEPQVVVALGDSFHDTEAASRLTVTHRHMLKGLQMGREWIWIAGNHDPNRPEGVEGQALDELAIGKLVFRHEPSPVHAEGEIAGHLHPSARVYGRGKSVRRRCFAGDGYRLILPAFGAYTGGLDVLDKAFTGLFAEDSFRAFMLGDDRVYPVGPRALRSYSES